MSNCTADIGSIKQFRIAPPIVPSGDQVKIQNASSTQIDSIPPEQELAIVVAPPKARVRSGSSHSGMQLQGLEPLPKGDGPQTDGPKNVRFRSAAWRVVQARPENAGKSVETVIADANWSQLHQAVMDWVKLKSASSITSDGHVGLRGTVRVEDGKLKCSDKTIEALLSFVAAKYPEEAKNLNLRDESYELTLSIDPAEILLKAKEFENACLVRRIPLADGTTKDVNVNIAVYAAREAIKKGAKGFGKDAVLNLDKRDHAFDALGRQSHPFDFLSETCYSATSSHADLKALVNKSLSGRDADTLDLRGRLGAHAINSVLTEKRMTKATAYALAGSLTLAGGIGVGLDMFAWKAVIDILARIHGPEHPATRIAAVVLTSLTPLFAETVDSLILKRFLGAMRGEKLLWESMEEFLDDAKESATAGSFAALGSIPNNVLSLFKHPLLAIPGVPADALATTTSAALFPREIARRHKETQNAVIAETANGLFALPETVHADSADGVVKALEDHYNRETKGSIGAMKDTALVTNSLGIGPSLSVPVNLILDLMERLNVVPGSVNVPVSIGLNTPTEIVSAVIHVLGRYVGMGGLMTTDTKKGHLLMQTLLEKAKENIGKPDAVIEVTEKELRGIEHAKGEFAFPMGEAIVGGATALSKAAGTVTAPVAALTVKGVNAMLASIAEITNVALPQFEYVPEPHVDTSGITRRMPGHFPEDV